MSEQPTAELLEAEAFANGMFAGIQLVTAYMKECLPMIQGVLTSANTTDRDLGLQSLYYRSYAWMQSLERLNQVKHIQAISVGTRALLELLVDTFLVYDDKTNNIGAKMYAWTQSEHMRFCELLVEYYQKRGVPIPEEHKLLEQFHDRNKASIEITRRATWPTGKNAIKARHPEHWTGRNLLEDIEEVDRLYGPQIEDELGYSLHEFYRTRFRKLNWYIHSGSAGIAGVPAPSLSIACGFSLRWSAKFALLCTKVTLLAFGFSTAIDHLQEKWDEIGTSMDLAFAQLHGKHRDAF